MKKEVEKALDKIGSIMFYDETHWTNVMSTEEFKLIKLYIEELEKGKKE